MSDVFPGAGWWMASDGKWYAPQLHHDPAYRAKYAEPEPDVVDDEPEADVAEAESDATPTEDTGWVDGAEAAEEAAVEDTAVEDVAVEDTALDDTAVEQAVVDDAVGDHAVTEDARAEGNDDIGGAGMPPPVVKPVEPVYDDETATIVAQAAPPPDIRWPDLPEVDAAPIMPETADRDEEIVDDEDEPSVEPTGLEGDDSDNSDDSDEDWVSHVPADGTGGGGISVAQPSETFEPERPVFETRRPPSVVGDVRPGSRARLEVGRPIAEADPAPLRAQPSTISFDTKPHQPLTTSAQGLTEIRVYKEPAEIIDRIIAAVLFLAGLAMIVGTFLDWVREAGADTTGWERGDGIATVFAGVFGAAAAGPIFVGFRHIVPKTVAIVCGLVGAVVVGLVGLDVMSDTATAGTSLGVGFWVVLIGALAMIIAGVAERTSIR